jgi:hypothetical protein
MKTVLLQQEEVWNTITIIEMRKVILLVKSRLRGQKGLHWNWTINNNLKLIHNNVLARSGAARLKVKPGYAVQLRITVGEEDFHS